LASFLLENGNKSDQSINQEEREIEAEEKESMEIINKY
jgi:hypothetical protein